jgi:hypothetical protein
MAFLILTGPSREFPWNGIPRERGKSECAVSAISDTNYYIYYL